MDNRDVIERIKKSFCNLTSFKERSNALEIITAYSTLNNKFVSVFITFTRDKIIVTDSGWIRQNYYETPLHEDFEEIVSKVISTYASAYEVKSTVDKSGLEFYYKNCKSVAEVSSTVFDMANFTVGVVNAFCIQYKDEKEEKDRETFRADANNFLIANYGAEEVKLRTYLDDFKNIKFNAIINRKSTLSLITYVTGSNQYYFENDLRKSIVNFEITAKSKFQTQVKERITIVNNTSDGYHPDKSTSLFELLGEKTTRKPIKWTEKEELLEIL